jgi:Tol biopolymer transport system component
VVIVDTKLTPFQLAEFDIKMINGVPTALPLTDFPNTSAAGANLPTVSASGNRLAFGEGYFGDGSLFTMDIVGGVLQPSQKEVYTPAPGALISFSAINPAGTQIAFTEQGPNAGQNTMKIIDITTNVVMTMDPAVSQLGPVHMEWSPYRNLIAFDCGSGIYTVPASTTGQPQFVVGGSHPSWNPDGTKLVFQSNLGLATIDLYTGTITNLTNKGASWPKWLQ